MDWLEHPTKPGAAVRRARPVADWAWYRPRVAGAVLLVLAAVAGRALCHFFWGRGSIDASLSSAVLYASVPGLSAVGLWLLGAGAPKTFPRWWLSGTAAVVMVGFTLSCALALAIDETPKERILRFDESGHDFVRYRRE